MSSINYKRFSTSEDDLLREKYPVMGRAVCKLLPHRNESSIMGRVARLGLIRDENTAWTLEEDDILRKQYPLVGDEAVQFLPQRTLGSIRIRARELGLLTEFSRAEERCMVRNGSENADVISSNNRRTISLISYPLNLYITLYGTHRGYDKSHVSFEFGIDQIWNSLITKNKRYRVAKKVFDRYFQEHHNIDSIATEFKVDSDKVQALIDWSLDVLNKSLKKVG